MCLKQTGVTYILINQVVFLMDIQCLLSEVEIEFLNNICIHFVLQSAQSG